MKQPYHSDFNLSHEQVYLELERLQKENYHLKKQLKNQRSINKGQKKYTMKLERKVKSMGGDRQKYRNGRKRGQHGFNG